MRSFLDSIVPGIRCQNPNCQALAPVSRPITVRILLFGEYACYNCGWEYAGALTTAEAGGPTFIEIAQEARKFSKELIEQLDEAEQPKGVDKMNRAELVEELARLKLKLEDVPVSGKAVTNGDIRDYIIGWQQENA